MNPKMYRTAENYTRILILCLLCQVAFGPHSVISNGLLSLFHPEFFSKCWPVSPLDVDRLVCIHTSGVAFEGTNSILAKQSLYMQD
jgi:hypothetical protein